MQRQNHGLLTSMLALAAFGAGGFAAPGQIDGATKVGHHNGGDDRKPKGAERHKRRRRQLAKESRARNRS